MRSAEWNSTTSWTLEDEGNKTTGYGGGGGTGDSAIADKVLKAYRHSEQAFADSREDSEKGMRYVNNDSWSSTDKATAETHKKPTLKYNIIMPILSTLIGNEQLNRKRARFVPSTLDSVNVVDIIQGRWNALNDEMDIEEKLQSAFLDALITKMGGWIERKFIQNAEGYLDYKYDIVNNMRVYLDPEAKTNDYELKHCRWIIKEGWEPLDVIEEKYEVPYGKMVKEDSKIKWWDALGMYFKRFKDSEYSSGSARDYDKENDRYKILEMQERVYRRVFRCWDGQDYVNLTPEEYREMKRGFPQLKKLREFEEDAIHITTIIPYFNNLVVMDEDMGNPVANFDVFPVFSYNLSTQVSEATSLVDLLLDVQDDVNKGKSQARDYVTQLLSGGIFIAQQEKDVIKQLKTKGNQPNQIYTLKDAINKPFQLPPGQIPPDIFNNTENSVLYANRLSLITEGMKGEVGKSGESGVLFQKKIERAAAAINPYYKNLSNLRKTLAKDFVDNFSFVYSEYDRVIKIKNDGGIFADEVVNLAYGGKILNNVYNASLYVELDEGEDNITAKEENFEKMLALANVIGQINPQLVDVRTLVSIAPIRGVDKMLEYIDNMVQQQAESTESAKRLEETKQTLENMKIERGMITDEEKLQLEAKKIDTKGSEREGG